MCRRLVNILTQRMRYDWFKQFLINQFESVLRFSQISIRIRIGIQFLVIVYYEVMFYILMMLMKFSFVPQNFFSFFLQDQDQDQDSTSKINKKSYALCFKDTQQIWCRSARFFSKSKSCSRWGSGSGSWFYFGFRYSLFLVSNEESIQKREKKMMATKSSALNILKFFFEIY